MPTASYLTVIAGIAVLVWLMRRLHFKSPPIIPFLYRSAALFNAKVNNHYWRDSPLNDSEAITLTDEDNWFKEVEK